MKMMPLNVLLVLMAVMLGGNSGIYLENDYKFSIILFLLFSLVVVMVGAVAEGYRKEKEENEEE